jgi:uncharacterized membrane protein YccC
MSVNTTCAGAPGGTMGAPSVQEADVAVAVVIALVIACSTVAALLPTLLAVMYRRRWQACRRRFEQMCTEHRLLHARTLTALDAATEALAAAEDEWRQSLDRIQQDYDGTVEQLRVRQAAALARLQSRLPRPRTHRLYGDERP